MAEISLGLPIGLSFDLIDYDSVLPSLNARINVDLTARSLSAVQLKLNSVRFFCCVWDQFIDDLLANRTAILADMDQALTIKVTSEPEDLTLVITFQEGALNNYSTDIQLTAKLDHDSIFILKEQFKNFPKWW